MTTSRYRRSWCLLWLLVWALSVSLEAHGACKTTSTTTTTTTTTEPATTTTTTTSTTTTTTTLAASYWIDTFNRGTGLGASWTSSLGTLQIVSDTHLAASAATDTFGYADADAFTPTSNSNYACGQVDDTDGYAGPCLAVTDEEAICCLTNPANTGVDYTWFDNDQYETNSTRTCTVADGYYVGIVRLDSNSFQCYVDADGTGTWTACGAQLDLTDEIGLAGQFGGAYAYGTTAQIDNVEVGDGTTLPSSRTCGTP